MLEYCSIDHSYENVDVVGMYSDPINAMRNYQFVNPAESLPMVVHDGFKIMGCIDNFLKYLASQYPEIKSQLYGDDLDHDQMERYLSWITKVLEI